MKSKTCQRCYYVWFPRVKTPKACPKCKSHLWNVVREGAKRE